MVAEAVRLPVVSADEAVDFSLVAARAAFGDLEGWAMSEEACALPEHEVETEMEHRGREAIRLMLQAHMNRRGTGRVGPALRVVGPEGEARHEEARVDPKKIVSIFGDVTARRTAYAAEGARSVHPLDETASLPARSFSYELQRRVVDEAVRGPFDEAVESIEKTTGNTLSKRSAEEVVRDAASEFDAFYEERKAPSAEGTGPILVAAVDCKGVPMVKPEAARRTARRKKGEKANRKKMATVATVFTQEPRIRTPEEVVASLFRDTPEEDTPQEKAPRARPEHKRVWASIEKTKDEVIGEVVAEMTARDPEGAKLRVAVTDGERALQTRVKKAVPGITLVLDLLHALEYLWKAAYAFHAEGSDEAAEWVRRRALMILRGEVSQVVKGMRGSATKRGLKGAKRKAVDSAAGYFMRNRKRMRYDEYLAKGLPIASGAVEGACKNLVKDRMERSGMRWRVPGAEAMLRLRAVRLSGDMDEYWPFHIAREQERLYGGRTWRALE
jgi:hypothetical protein